MNHVIGYVAVSSVILATAFIGFYGLRISRTTSDFYVASRTVRPWWNASAIGGEYLSAASFLGIAGLILLSGQDALWFPIGYTAGYLMLLLFVAAPLRRSGAFTIPDFVESRLESASARRITSLLVIVVGWFYIVPQLHGAALAIRISTGLSPWVGAVAVSAVVCLVVVTGGMRSITFVQAFQFWLKLTAIAVPVVFLLLIVVRDNPSGATLGAELAEGIVGTEPASVYRNVSLIIALLFGTLGLPHVLVRFYTNPDGGSARRTTVIVLGLLAVFYFFPTVLGFMGRAFMPELAASGQADAVVLLLPNALAPGMLGDILTAMVIAGAFAAFLSTTSGLVVSLAGVISQDLFGGSVRGFRWAAVLASVVPLGVALLSDSSAIAGAVGLVFAFTASTICPLLLLGIWWRGLTAQGAIAGTITGAALCGGAILLGPLVLPAVDAAGLGLVRDLLAQPAACTVPLAFAVMIGVSLATSASRPLSVSRVLARLHTPEQRPYAG